MQRLEHLQTIVNRYDLNEHPFYKAWRAGTLPRATLAHYASEYGRFIDTLALGWETLGENAYADEERAHATLWDSFETAVGASENAERVDEVQSLVQTAQQLFSTPAEATGALIAFEIQQPSTSASKLAGLDEHYAIPGAGRTYFEVHAKGTDEVTRLAGHLDALDDDAFARAAAACEQLSRGTWSALDGILAAGGSIVA